MKYQDFVKELEGLLLKAQQELKEWAQYPEDANLKYWTALAEAAALSTKHPEFDKRWKLSLETG